MKLSFKLFFLALLTSSLVQISHAAPHAAGAPTNEVEKKSSTKRIVEANPRSLEANEQGIVALKTGNTRTAEDRFRRALEVDSGNLTAAFNLSGTLVVNGKKLEAIALLSDYSKKYPRDAGFETRLGDVLFSSEKIPESIPHYERALKIQPSYPKLYEKLALAYALTQKLEQSEQMYKLAVKAAPKDSELLTNLANIQLGNGKIDASIITAKKAAQLKPSSRLYLTLGSALENKGSLDDALAAFNKAKELGESGSDVVNRIAALEVRLKK